MIGAATRSSGWLAATCSIPSAEKTQPAGTVRSGLPGAPEKNVADEDQAGRGFLRAGRKRCLDPFRLTDEADDTNTDIEFAHSLGDLRARLVDDVRCGAERRIRVLRA